MNDAGARVLVVDDEPHISELLVTTLHFAGFRATAVSTGADVPRLLRELDPALVILDVMLPDVDGFEVARRMRGDGYHCPVLFLTAKDGTEDKVTGLMLGGDDYVTKPFSVSEVIARVHAVLRRTRGGSVEDYLLRCADLQMDEGAHEVRRAGKLIDLSPTEYRLLRYLLLNAGRVVSKAQILDRVWQYDFAGDGAVVEKFISNLRHKIAGPHGPMLQTVRGFGYVLREPSR
jgi:two-component system OmpR family response regulator